MSFYEYIHTIVSISIIVQWQSRSIKSRRSECMSNFFFGWVYSLSIESVSGIIRKIMANFDVTKAIFSQVDANKDGR